MYCKNSVKLSSLLLGASLISCAEKEPERPNIIYIMSDDHAYQAISAYGSGLNATPNLDRLADEGAIFNRACVTNSISAPSRAVLLTGKHSFINGKIDNGNPFDWDQNTFTKVLQANGYETAMIGKIHIDGEPQGFDFSMVLMGQGEYYNPEFLINGKEKKVIEGYCTDIVTETTIDWIDTKRDKDKPFCVLYHQKAPHREWLPALRHIKEYTSKTYNVPESLFSDNSGRGEAAKTSEMSIKDHMNWAGDMKIYPDIMDRLGIAPYSEWDYNAFDREVGRMNPEQRAEWDKVYRPIMEQFEKDYPNMSQEDLVRWKHQRYMQDYVGTIAAIDEGIGELLDYLEETGLDENTIIMYTSDQGFYLGENGWYDKRFMYEESFRTPLLMRYPKEIKPGTQIDQLVQNLDFAPTILDFAGIEIPEDMQGLSFRNLVNGKSGEWRDAVYYTYYEYPGIHAVKRHYGIATDRYKLMHFYYDIDQWEMYDLETDPGEQNNLYGNPDYAEVQEMLHKRLEELRVEYGDSDQRNNQYISEQQERMRKAAERAKQKNS